MALTTDGTGTLPKTVGWSDISGSLTATAVPAGTYLIRAQVPWEAVQSSGGAGDAFSMAIRLNVDTEDNGTWGDELSENGIVSHQRDAVGTSDYVDSGVLWAEMFVSAAAAFRVKVEGVIVVIDADNTDSFTIHEELPATNHLLPGTCKARLFIHRIA